MKEDNLNDFYLFLIIRQYIEQKKIIRGSIGNVVSSFLTLHPKLSM